MIFRLWITAIISLGVLGVHPGAARVVKFNVLLVGTETPAPVRCRLTDSTGKAHYPHLFKAMPVGPAGYFYPEGEFELRLNDGETYHLETDRGVHWITTSSDFVVSSTTTRVINHTGPYVDLWRKRWYSADLDLDVPVSRVESILGACDLNVASRIYESTPEIEPGAISGVDHFPRERAFSRVNFGFGDFNTINVIPGTRLDETTFEGIPLPQLEAARAGAGWLDLVRPESEWAPVAAALGLVDSVRLVGPESEWTETWDEAAVLRRFEAYYALLNCGFQFGATAASLATEQGLDPRDRAGSSRVYVRIPSDFSYGHFFRRLKEGRSWATNGPILSLSVNGLDLGKTVGTKPGNPLRISVGVRSPRTLDRLEVIYNGTVVSASTPASATSDLILADFQIPADQSGWIAARAFEKHEDPTEPFRYAHSSPVYVRVEGRDAFDAAVVQRFANELTERIRGLGSQKELSKEARDYLADRLGKARDRYLEIIR